MGSCPQTLIAFHNLAGVGAGDRYIQGKDGIQLVVFKLTGKDREMSPFLTDGDELTLIYRRSM